MRGWNEAAAASASGQPAWARAREALAQAFDSVAPDSRLELGWVRPLGRGLYREGWWSDVKLDPDPDGWTGE